MNTYIYIYATRAERVFSKVRNETHLWTLATLHVVGEKVTVKGKAIPLQAWTGPEGSRRLRLPVFKTIWT